MPTSVSLREDDPLLKDLSEKKHSFRRNVVSLATELKEARIRLIEQERSSSKEAMSRQEAETRVQKMEDEIHELTKEFNKKVEQILIFDIATEKYVKELGDIKLQLAATQATSEASAMSAESAQSQCRVLSSQLHEKTRSLKEHEDQVIRLGEKLEDLRKKLQAIESSQKQLRDEVLKVEGDIMRAVSVVRTKDNFEMQRVLDEDNPNNFGRINKLLMAKDDEIARLRDELKIISAHWRFKTKELEDQVENQRRNDQELKKKVLKLEFYLRETRFQTRKLQKIAERDDVAIQELKKKLAAKEQHEANLSSKQNLWDKSGFKIVVSMSMLILVAFSRR